MFPRRIFPFLYPVSFAILMALSAHAGEPVPYPVEPGIFSDLAEKYWPQIWVRENGQNHLSNYTVARQSGVACALDKRTLGHFYPVPTEPEADVFSYRNNSNVDVIQRLTPHSFRYRSDFDTKKDPLAQLLGSPSVMVRVGDEEKGYALLESLPFCPGAFSVYQPAKIPQPPFPKSHVLMVDLGERGIALGTPRQAVLFDIDANGFKDKMVWPRDEGSYFLVVDRNRNGNIDNGSEMFTPVTHDAWGKVHRTGFTALASYDSNRDGWIDAEDGIFAHLRLWNDRNRDGNAETSELQTPCDLQVKGFETAFIRTDDRVDENGNGRLKESRVRMNDGTFRELYEVGLINPF